MALISQVVEFLLLHGADPYQTTTQGYTAVDLANSSTVRDSLLQIGIPNQTIVKKDSVSVQHSPPKAEASSNRTSEPRSGELSVELREDGVKEFERSWDDVALDTLSQNQENYQEYFKNCEFKVSGKEGSVSPRLSPTTDLSVNPSQLQDPTPGNFQNDLALQPQELPQSENFKEQLTAFDTSANTQTETTGNTSKDHCRFGGAVADDAVNLNRVNEGLDKAFVQIPSYMAHEEETYGLSSPTERTGSTDGNSSDLSNEKAELEGSADASLSRHADGSFENDFIEDGEITGHAVRPDSPCCEQQTCNEEARESYKAAHSPGNSYNSDASEIHVGCGQQESGKFTKITSVEGEPRISQSYTVAHVGARSIRKRRRSRRISEHSKPKKNTASLTSEAGNKTVSSRSRVGKGCDEGYDENDGQREMCLNHIANKTWRAALETQRYKASSLPICIPGYQDFLMNTKSYSLSCPSTEAKVSLLVLLLFFVVDR